MLSSTVIAALAAGFLGSFHCALMCGPLLAAGCGPRRRGVLSYFAGRLVSYALAGAIFGQLGAHAAHHFSSTSVQHTVLALVAMLALARGLQLLFARRSPDLVPLRRISQARSEQHRVDMRAAGRAASPESRPAGRGAPSGERRSWLAWLASLLPRRALPLGLITGALPCGMLASGWALAASTGRPSHGALVMAVFSLATAPALLLGLLASLPALRRRWTPAVQGISWCVLAIWIGARPLFDQIHGGH